MVNNNAIVMLEDSVIEFLKQMGTVMFVDFQDGKGPTECYVINKIVYVSTDEDNKFFLKSLDKL